MSEIIKTESGKEYEVQRDGTLREVSSGGIADALFSPLESIVSSLIDIVIPDPNDK